MSKSMIFPLVLLAAGIPADGAFAADATVECISHNYQYNECYAPLQAPQLVYQSSNSACIVNRTWGFNPTTRRIWVSEGCSGVFADPSGYHHGKGGTADSSARQYDHRGHDTGAVVAGAILGALIEGAASSGKKHTTTNNYVYTSRSSSGYTGCHGIGCLADNPDYSSSGDSPPEPGQTTFSNDSPPEPGQTTFSDDSPPEPGQTDFSSSSSDDN